MLRRERLLLHAQSRLELGARLLLGLEGLLQPRLARRHACVVDTCVQTVHEPVRVRSCVCVHVHPCIVHRACGRASYSSIYY